MKRIALDKLVVRDELFLRDDYNEDAIERYKELYESGKTKAIMISKVGEEYVLVDGFHRVRALRELKKKFVDAEVKPISENELRSRAIEENLKHGVPLSKDERNGLIKKLYLEDNKTQQEIADIVNLGQRQISRLLDLDLKSKINIQTPKLWLQGGTDKQIAKELKVSSSRIRQIVSEFKKKVLDLYSSGQTIGEIQEQVFRENKVKPSVEKVKEILCSYKLPKELVDLPKLLEGDCLNELDKVPDKCVDLIYVDPPYCILDKKRAKWDVFKSEKAFWDFTEAWLAKLLPKLKDDGRLFISFSQEKMWRLHDLIEEKFSKKHGLIFCNCIVWNYRNNIKPNNRKLFKFTWEPVFHYCKPKTGQLNSPDKEWGESNGNTDVDVWTMAMPQTNFNVDKKEHPTQKPKQLLEKIIKYGSEENDLVLDCFAGSGTTGLLARELKRNWILIEKKKEYTELIRRRLFGNI